MRVNKQVLQMMKYFAIKPATSIDSEHSMKATSDVLCTYLRSIHSQRFR